MLPNTASAAIHTDTHFGATKNVLLEATYHPDARDTKNWAKQNFKKQLQDYLRITSILLN